MAKILILDIETRPAIAYVWGLFRENIGIQQLISPSAPICFAAKWLDGHEMIFHSDWKDGHEEMIKRAHELISEADAVVTYNGDKFDLRKLQGEFLLAGLLPPPPPTSIDVLKTVKKFGFQSNKLAFIGPLLKVGRKVANEGFDLWAKVEAGNECARRRMERYCIGDVRLLERVYLNIRPYIFNHPHMGEIGSRECGACGSARVQKRGRRRTKVYSIQRLQCQNCGSWQDGERKKI